MPLHTVGNSVSISHGKDNSLPLHAYSNEQLLRELIERQRIAYLNHIFVRQNDYVGLYIEIKAFEHANIRLFPPSCTSFPQQAAFLTTIVGWQVDYELLKNRFYLERGKHSYQDDIIRRAAQLQ